MCAYQVHKKMISSEQRNGEGGQSKDDFGLWGGWVSKTP